jgi:hypothetical protein
MAWPVLVLAEMTVQPHVAWPNQGRRRSWIALLWAVTAVWVVQFSWRTLLGAYCPLLIAMAITAGITFTLTRSRQKTRPGDPASVHLG